MNAPLWRPEQLERNRFVRFRTAYTFDRFVDLPREGNLKILDFGCGDGHSIDALLDRFPNAHFTGVDISPIPQFAGHPRVTAIRMQGPTATGSIGSGFDVIQLNAVFEHLLPVERRQLMPDLWRRLAVGGYLVVTETPWRWFPIETHTTSLPFVNYLPDRLAFAAFRYCGRFPHAVTWKDALREGLRGGTVGEIVSCLDAPKGTVQFVQASEADARDMLEVWWRGECRHTRRKAFAYNVLRWFHRLTGIVVSPWVNFVLRKSA
jgi:SAM-dependent methyltransferase